MSWLVLGLGACTFSVNGKPHHFGGGGGPQPQPVATAQPAATATAPEAPAAPTAAAPRALPPAAVMLKVDSTLTSTPMIARADGVAFVSFSSVFGHGASSPDCGANIAPQPIASVELAAAVDTMTLAVAGGSNDGFLLVHGDTSWTTCTTSTGEVPAMSAIAGGWKPGRYDIFPLTRYAPANTRHAFDIEVYAPGKPAPIAASVKRVAIGGKLAAPMFVEVTTSSARRVLRELHAGYGCGKAALPDQPDLVLDLARPIAGLVVRPLASATPIVLRRELTDATSGRIEKGCPRREESSRSSSEPTYRSDHELHLGARDEGAIAMSLGTASATRPATVTLMIYDASTTLDPLAPYDLAGSFATLEDRVLVPHFPQFDIRTLAATDWAHLELAAKVFAAVPPAMRVYAKLDLDKDLASGASDASPHKNEPLVVIDSLNSRVEVLAADGLRFSIAKNHLLLAPDGEAAPITQPRSLGKVDLGRALALLSPALKPLGAAFEKSEKDFAACRDRAWEPYGRQLPTISRPMGVEVVYVESAHNRQLRDAGAAAQDRLCGTEGAFAKKGEATRVKLVAAIDKARVALLATAMVNR